MVRLFLYIVIELKSKMASAPPKKKRKYLYRCHSIEEVVSIDFTWVIDNFESCTEKNGEYLKSSEFGPEEMPEKWWFQLYPRGDSKDCLNHISLFLFWKSTSEGMNKRRAKALFRIVNENGAVRRNFGPFVNTFNNDQKNFGYRKFLKREEVLNPDKGLLFDGKLMINCQLSIYSGKTNVQTQNVLIEESANELPLDLGELFKSGLITDVILCVEKEEIKAHKCILSARSKVFAAMFAHEMKENQENRVEISDISHPVLLEMLHYMYSGEASKLDTMAKELLVASDKYDLLGLKQKCAQNLIKCLCRDNAVDLLILADQHSATLLKSYAIDFIKLFPQDVMKGYRWKKMMNLHPNLLVEICEAIFPTREAASGDDSETEEESDS